MTAATALGRAALLLLAACTRAGEPPAAPARPSDWTGVIAKVAPSVVSVLRDPRGAAERLIDPASGLGAGFVIDEHGHVVTNEHVIESAEAVQVELSDGRRRPAAVVGRDPDGDVAVLRVERRDGDAPLSPARLGSSESLRVGEWVVAIGNPLGMGPSATAGIVSATGRRASIPGAGASERPGYWRFIQTDASLNPGYSGGPLCNARGEVVGMSTAINRDAQGIGFAIPIDLVRALVPALLREGRVARSRLGVQARTVDEQAARLARLTGAPRGALIAAVDADTPAARAGLRSGDVILEFDGKPVASAEQLAWMASLARAGQPVPLLVWREGGPRRVSVAPEPK